MAAGLVTLFGILPRSAATATRPGVDLLLSLSGAAAKDLIVPDAKIVLTAGSRCW